MNDQIYSAAYAMLRDFLDSIEVEEHEGTDPLTFSVRVPIVKSIMNLNHPDLPADRFGNDAIGMVLDTQLTRDVWESPARSEVVSTVRRIALRNLLDRNVITLDSDE